MTLDFRILGHVQMRRDDAVVDVGGRRQRAVLAVLLLRANRMISFDEIIDDVWAGHPPAGAKATLHAYVSKLRRTLEPDRSPGERGGVLVSESSGYLLRVEADQIDANRFEARAEAGRAALAGGDPEQAATLLGAALTLWRGPALADFASEAFAASYAARLEDLRLTVIEDHIEAALALGRHRSVRGELEDLVQAHPLRERLWGQLMVALYRAGREAEALQAYDEARTVLCERLGIGPSPTLRTLERAIVDGAPALEWRPPRRSVLAPTRVLAGSEVVSPVFVGRDEELVLLHRRFGEALAGRGRLVLMTGDSGIGKTRLAEEFAATARLAQAEVVWGRGDDGGGAPAFSPWIEVVRALAARIDPVELRAALGMRAADVARIVPEVQALVSEAEWVALQRPDTTRFRHYDAMVRFFTRLAAHRPLVILLDDVHLADVASLELLAFFGVELRTAPMLLVATYRDIEVHPTHLLVSTLTRLGYEPAVSRLALRGLTLAEVTRFVAEATGVEPSAALVSALHQRTDGNPLFLGELIRLLQADNQLSPSAAVAATVPDEVRAVIGRRLADLPPTTLRLLEVAAVAGRDFDFELVGAAQGLTPDRTLARLEAAFLTRLLTDDPAVPGRYRFAHPLVQEVLYTGLNRRRRTRFHHRIATTTATHP